MSRVVWVTGAERPTVVKDKSQRAGNHSFLVQGETVNINSSSNGARSRSFWILTVSIVVVVVLGAFIGIQFLRKSEVRAEVFLAPSDAAGDHPFMPISPPAVGPFSTGPRPTFTAPTGDTAVGAKQVVGSEPGVYGGLRNQATGGRDEIVAFYETHPDRARAFVDALRADPAFDETGGSSLQVSGLADYLRTLTPVISRIDIRVTDHEFADGKVSARESVLQAGTAILIDLFGVPRVRSISGSPLTVSTPSNRIPDFTGSRWPQFQPGFIAAMTASSSPQSKFILVDIVVVVAFDRRVGTVGDGDSDTTEPVVPGPDSSSSSVEPSTPRSSSAAQTPESVGLDLSGPWVLQSTPENTSTGTVTEAGDGFRFNSNDPRTAVWDCLLNGRPGQSATLTCTSEYSTWVGSGEIVAIPWGSRTKFRFDGISSGVVAGMPMILRPS
ncbi:DUF6777 domain-containing protein [Nocardia sp. NPDC005366]|uniref:DUF6777 domain-containing protein n=1 Tax=Nocardia sp. NPDC005366 TaxID=3156878 RepID=UPI0033B3DEE5